MPRAWASGRSGGRFYSDLELHSAIMGKDGHDRFCQADMEAAEAVREEVLLTGGN